MNNKKHEKFHKKILCFISNLSKVNNQMTKVCIKVVKVYLKSQQKERNNINSNVGGLVGGLKLVRVVLETRNLVLSKKRL